jgi:hypothetical protein
MSDAALSTNPTASAAACQAACAASADCQYFAFYANNAAGAQCLLRDKVPYSVANVADASKAYVLFEVGGPGAGPGAGDAEGLGQHGRLPT